MAVKYTSFAMVVGCGGIVDMSIVRSLEGRFFSGVVEAADATEAMSRLRLVSPSESRSTALKAPPGLIIISVSMADMDPFEFCRLVKESYPDMFTILVATAETLSSASERMPGAHFDELLLSPFTANELAARVELLLTRHVGAVAPAPKEREHESKSLGRMPQPGDSLLGHIQILETLKAGAGIAVFKAIDKKSNNLCAVKALFGNALLDPLRAAAFDREGRTMSRISHPNVLACKERGESEGVRYIVSEWLEGPNLEDYLLVKGVPPLETFFKIAKDVALGLKAIHLQGMIHRDIKLSNILLRRASSDAVVSDMGIAQEAVPGQGARSGFVEGSRPYMAPELLEGSSADIRSDIYSYGAAMYQFLTGSPPCGRGVESLDGESQAPSPAQLLRPETPEGLDSFLVERCLARSPDARPSSMEEVHSTLLAIESGYAQPDPKSGRVVLLVDDEVSVLETLGRLLAREPYKLICVDSAEKALGVMASTKVHLLLTDYRMPGMNGVDLARVVKERSPDTIRIVFSGQADTESVIAAINSGNVYKYLVKSWFREDIRQNIRLALDHYSLLERNRELDAMLAGRNRELSEINTGLERRIEERNAEAVEARRRSEKHCKGLVEALFKIIELHSEDMSQHGRRVGRIAKTLAIACGASEALANEIETAGYLHDIGKLSIGFESGSGRMRLSVDEEARLMRSHPSIGAKILESVPEFSSIAAMVRSHHERYDGQGLPDSLAGEDICFGARILAIADRFDRLARVPGSGMPRRLQFVEDAILKLSGLELDPVMLKIFISGTSATVYAELYAPSGCPRQ